MKRILTLTLIVLFSVTMFMPAIAATNEQPAEELIDGPVFISVFIPFLGWIDVPAEFMTWSELKQLYGGGDDNGPK